MEKINNEQVIVQPNQASDNDSILGFYNNVDCHMSRYGCISISKKDQEILKSSNDFLNYSKAVFNNKKNRNKFKSIIALGIFEVFSLLLIAIAILINIPNIINKKIDNIVFFLFATFGFAFIIEAWSSIVYDFRGWFLWGNKSISGKDKSNISVYFISEYLKCRYEALTNSELSDDRVNQIKGNLNYAYYNLEKKETIDYINKDKKISNKWNETNYISKSEKIKKILKYNFLYEIILILFTIILVVIVLNIFVWK